MNSSGNIFITQNKDSHLFFSDQSLDKKTAGICDLLILIDESIVQLALKERRTGRLLAFEFISNREHREPDWKILLENVSSLSKVLRNYEFSKVTAGIISCDYTLVPEALFKQGDESEYYRKNFSFYPETIVRSRLINSGHLYTVFGVERELEKELNHLFENPNIWHHSQALFAGISVINKGVSEKQIWLNVHRDKIDLVVTENKKLLLMNSFMCQTSEEILYYTLFVAEQMEMNPENFTLNISGETEIGSALYLLLYKYIRNIDFAKRPATISFQPDELSFHQYTLLYNLSLCE